MNVHAIDWGDVPTWISAITTLGALVAAGVIVYLEVRRDRRAAEQRAREDQANSVAAWHSTETDGHHILVRNGSTLPVYRVVVGVVHNRGVTHEAVRMIPPGDFRIPFPEEIEDWPPHTDLRLWFTDTAGRSWRRRADGRLRQVEVGEEVPFYQAVLSGDAAPELEDEPPL